MLTLDLTHFMAALLNASLPIRGTLRCGPKVGGVGRLSPHIGWLTERSWTIRWS